MSILRNSGEIRFDIPFSIRSSPSLVLALFEKRVPLKAVGIFGHLRNPKGDFRADEPSPCLGVQDR